MYLPTNNYKYFGYCGHYWPIVPVPDERWWWLWRNWWNEDWQGKPKYSEKTCPSATLSTTNTTRLDQVFNPGRRGGKPATNRLSYGAAIFTYLLTSPKANCNVSLGQRGKQNKHIDTHTHAKENKRTWGPVIKTFQLVQSCQPLWYKNIYFHVYMCL
jgi:hypothetical protein